MKILERNYSEKLQSYSFPDRECDKEAKILLRWNLLSRLSKLVKGELSYKDKTEELLPRTEVKITRVSNPEVKDKYMYLSELKVRGMKFPRTDTPVEESINEGISQLGIDLPIGELDNRLMGFYENKITGTPFNILKLEGEELPINVVSDKEFSYIEDSLYAETDEESHYKMVRAVSMLALHKHLSENPSSPRERIIQGINNLSKEITDEERKSELHDYLMIYIEKPQSRPLLVKEAQLVIDNRSKAAGKGFPLWIIMTIISLILVGGILYSQRDRIKSAWTSTKDMKSERGSQPDFKTKKTFFQMLFTKKGRDLSKKYINDKNSFRSMMEFLGDIDLKKKEAEVKLERNSYDMKSFLNNFGK